MTTDRRFVQLQRGILPPRLGRIPEGGVCISAFVVISRRGDSKSVLMGRINKSAPWDHIGALDPGRVERHSKGWMLPSSHLIFGESPQDAGVRILREQLGVEEQRLEAPQVFSEVYGALNHWDLEFVFLGERSDVPNHKAWNELKFIDLTETRKEEIARSHEDILVHIGKWQH